MNLSRVTVCCCTGQYFSRVLGDSTFCEYHKCSQGQFSLGYPERRNAECSPTRPITTFFDVNGCYADPSCVSLWDAYFIFNI